MAKSRGAHDFTLFNAGHAKELAEYDMRVESLRPRLVREAREDMRSMAKTCAEAALTAVKAALARPSKSGVGVEAAQAAIREHEAAIVAAKKTKDAPPQDQLSSQ